MTPHGAVEADLSALLERHAGDHDPLMPFLRTYLQMTRHLTDAMARTDAQGPRFRDAPSVGRLTEIFAGYFLTAVRSPDHASRCWKVLLGERPGPWHPLPRALAGMNAHINYDLALAVVDICHEANLEPTDGSPLHADYLTVNAVLGEAFEGVKTMFMTGPMAPVDRALGRLDDAVELWSIQRAREAAWVRGQVLWSLSEHPRVRDAYLDSHDRLVAMVGRSLLAAGRLA